MPDFKYFFTRTVFTALLTIILAFASGCKEDSNENNGIFGLLLLINSSSLSSSDCENNSGLVICIPPGLRQ